MTYLSCEEQFDTATMQTASPDDVDMELVDEWYSSMLAQERAQFQYAPQPHYLKLVCLVCLWIATKFASVDCEVPTIEEIYAYGHQQYSVDEIKAYEMAMLKALQWQLHVLTPIHFTEFYLTSPPLFPDDDINGYQLTDPAAYATVYAKHVEFLTEMCLQEYAFNQWLPSVLATAMLCVARRIVHITYDSRVFPQPLTSSLP
ncbi:hypothetical protein DYB32_002143 [Aphanomyces invadans]|uniref:Cyclin N-terminal domain-containing protein n=1 Tax=Aphanomyces invadans TaxID=157072 RepID=A0A3R6YDG3_9STRA|nr:hypothetical protein DYB32_002143 [Aphanomyces invadans]